MRFGISATSEGGSTFGGCISTRVYKENGARAHLSMNHNFLDLDNEIAKAHIGWADVWIDRYLRQGEQLENVLNLREIG